MPALTLVHQHVDRTWSDVLFGMNFMNTQRDVGMRITESALVEGTA